MKTIQPSITFGTPHKNIMGGQIGQLGMLPYGLTTTNAITT